MQGDLGVLLAWLLAPALMSLRLHEFVVTTKILHRIPVLAAWPLLPADQP